MDADLFDQMAEERLWPTLVDDPSDFDRLYDYENGARVDDDYEMCEEERAENEAFAQWESAQYEARMAALDEAPDAYLDMEYEDRICGDDSDWDF